MQQVLSDVEDIRVLKARYFRTLDAKQWAPLRALFTDDARFEHPVLGVFADIDTALAEVRDRIGDLTTVHQGSMPDITITGATSATGLWSMASLTFRSAAGGTGTRRTCGEYVEVYRREKDGWRIADLSLVSTYRETHEI